MQPLSIKELKFVRSLKVKKYRYKHACFVAEGNKIVTELIQESHPISAIYVSSDWLERNKDASFLAKVQVIPDKQLKEISQLSTQAGILAIAKMRENPIEQINFAQNYTLLLDKINDPGNLGTLIRLADWFGFPQIVCSPETVDCFNQKTIQATMGSIARIHVFYQDLAQFIGQHNQVPVYAAVLDAQSLYQYSFNENGFLLMGSESHGISTNLLNENVQKISIPRYGRAESLNVAMATAVIMGEVRRKKTNIP